MSDVLFDITRNTQITPYIQKVTKTPQQVQNIETALNGLHYIQSIGVTTYNLEIELVMHENHQADLMTAYHDVDRMRVVNDDETFEGFIVQVDLDDTRKAKGYFAGKITMLAEV